MRNSKRYQEYLQRVLPAGVDLRFVDKVRTHGVLYTLPGFKSAAITAVQNMRQEVASPDQWLATLLNASGVKRYEIDWMEIESWLKRRRGTVQKEVLLSQMQEKQIKLNEIVLKEETDLAQLLSIKEVKIHPEEERLGYLNAKEMLFASGVSYRVVSDTEGFHHAYYDDVPIIEGVSLINVVYQAVEAHHFDSSAAYNNAAKFSSSKIKGGSSYEERLITLDSLEGYESLHYETNEILHLRYDTREYDDKKILFLQEIQSDLHQVGQRIGYRTPHQERDIENVSSHIDQEVAKYKLIEGEYQDLFADLRKRSRDYFFNNPDERPQFLNAFLEVVIEKGQHYAEINSKYTNYLQTFSKDIRRLNGVTKRLDLVDKKIANYNKSIEDIKILQPHTPYKGDHWVQLGLRRILQYASQNGFDGVSWANAEQIARAVQTEPKKLSMLYDKKIPKFITKYTKKHGGEVQDIPLKIDDVANQTNKVVWITQEMRENNEHFLCMGCLATPEGAYDPIGKIIEVALSSANPERVIDHEVIHALKDLGLITEEEWGNLEHAAVENDWMSKHNIGSRYADVYEVDLKGRLLEEAVAEEYASWREGKDIEKSFANRIVQKVFQKISEFMEQLGLNIRSHEQEFELLFEKIYAGEISHRASDNDIENNYEDIGYG